MADDPAAQTHLAWLTEAGDGTRTLIPSGTLALHSEPIADPPAGARDPDPSTALEPVVADRYERRERLGRGASSEVWRVWDTVLERHVAMKVLYGPRSPNAWERFEAEARLSAKLQHPGIVPVHDLGRLDDGRIWFTMREVRGQTLKQARDDARWARGRLLEAFQRVCATVAYAHDHGVVHRDLKPANIMLGPYGEVLVVDWGLARGLDADTLGALAPSEVLSDSGAHGTRVGTVSGTPLFMAPEQAQGRSNEAGPPADVYALGGTLHHLLTGRAPRTAPTVAELIHAVATGAPMAIDVEDPGLRAILTTALSHAPEDRYPDAAALATALADWLDGVRRREQALERVAEADREREAATAARARADSLDAEGDAALAGVPGFAPEEDKAAGWALQDQAKAARRDAQLHEIAADRLLHGALRLVPDLPEALERLVLAGIDAHRAAIDARDEFAALRIEDSLVRQVECLPAAHPTARLGRAWLKGDAQLTLQSDPPGAEVRLFRFERVNRRLVPRFDRSLGTTPLDVTLPMGSFLLELRHPDCDVVRYPVSLERQGRWDPVPPGASEPLPVWLPPRGVLRPFERYVPAGFFWCGGDDRAAQPLPRQRIWMPGFAIDRTPVTNAQFVDFLNALVAEGRHDEAERYAPRERHQCDRMAGDIILDRLDDGRFALGTDSEGHEWRPDVPVVLVDRTCADGYLAWRARRDGLDARSPLERDRRPFGLEMEKAARGVDGRTFPWGDVADPAWACVGASHSGTRQPVSVDAFPTDESVYGVRHTAGNVLSMCENAWDAQNGALDDRFTPDLARPDDRVFIARGGSWPSTLDRGRCASRSRLEDHRSTILGIRGARSLER
jgi:serine/threonine-protein kinase